MLTWAVCGVDADAEPSREDGRVLWDEPLGRVEAQDADRVVAVQAQLQEGLGDRPGKRVAK